MEYLDIVMFWARSIGQFVGFHFFHRVVHATELMQKSRVAPKFEQEPAIGATFARLMSNKLEK